MKSLNQEYRDIFYALGLILMVVGFIFIIPILLSIILTESYIHAYLIPFAIIEGIGFILWRLNIKFKSILTFQQGAVSVVMAWIITMLISAIPFMIIADLNYTQSLFESVSGWTTTGLSMVDVYASPNSFLLYRSLLQFAGGFGLVAIMVSSIIGIGSLTTLYESEGHDQLLPNIKKTAQVLLIIYITITVVGIIAYAIVGMPVFDAINHSMSAISTGGFSVHSDSIGHYNSIPIESVTIVLMLLGSINFAAYILLLKGNFKHFKKISDNKFMAVSIVTALLIMIFLLTNYMYTSLSESIRVGMFEAISAITTTGYSIRNYALFPTSIIMLFVVLMIIGGQSGSTSGGIKITRFNLIIKSFAYSIKRIFQPENQVTDNVVFTPTGNKQIHKDDMIDIYNYLFIYLFALAFGTVILSLEGISLQSALFEYTSTLGTVGLSAGFTSNLLSPLSYWTMIIGMFLGRLEFMVVLIVFVKLGRDVVTWLKSLRKHKPNTL